jgi:serine/threonine protein kinase
MPANHNPAGAFCALQGLFEAWTCRLAPLGSTADVLRITSVIHRLSCAMGAACDGDDGSDLARVEELERATALAESAAQRFRQAHETLAETVSQILEAKKGVLAPGLVQARDAAFEQLWAARKKLEECDSSLDFDAIYAAARARLAPVESALAELEQVTDVKLAAALEADYWTDDGKDIATVKEYGTTLRTIAEGVAQRLQTGAASAWRFLEHAAACADDQMLKAASALQAEISAIAALESPCGEGLVAVLGSATPWDVILRCAARLLQPLRVAHARIGWLNSRAAALQSEVDAFVTGFEEREQVVADFEEEYTTMRETRQACGRFKLALGYIGDDDVIANEVDREEYARLQHACRVATRNRDEAARRLFLASKAYHPETLVQQQQELRPTGLTSVWNERKLEDYEQRQPLAHHDGSHVMFRAKYEGRVCILKGVQVQRGAALCREAEVLRRLQHPNIVKLEAAFIQSGLLYLHLPYARHGDLEQYLARQARMPPDARTTIGQLCHMARQLCEALAYLAERNVVHCDVKPANVFVDEEDDGSSAPIAILGDFDVSHTASGRTATMTVALQTRGVATHYSAGYAAPEVVRAPSGQLPRATSKLDVFGLGCVIYHMHMYPRTLPVPKSINDEITSDAGLFRHVNDALPECAVAAWAEAVPRCAIVSTTCANPIARISPRELLQTEYMRRAAGEYTRMDIQPPAYWQYSELAGSRVVPDPEVMAQVEKLLNDTAKPEAHGVGRDSHKRHFRRFKVTNVQRVENVEAWSKYAAHRRVLADALAHEGYVLPEQAGGLLSANFCYPLEGTLEEAAGEVFLLHGTGKPESIASSGFDVRYTHTRAGGGQMFGHGVYFAESASKSDQYVWPSAGGKLTMVLARVCLGRCQVVTEGRRNMPFLPEVEGLSTSVARVYYDSILTEVPGMRFREVLVGKDTTTYPELLVEYERV